MAEALGIIFGVVVGLVFLVALWHDWRRKVRRRRLLASRPALSDDAFAAAFYADSPTKAAIAVRLRKVLAANLGQPLDGLNPGDRLDDDLDTEVLANPHLFWEIEEEFDLSSLAPDFESLEERARTLKTFDDLVNYVAACRSGATSATCPDPAARSE